MDRSSRMSSFPWTDQVAASHFPFQYRASRVLHCRPPGSGPNAPYPWVQANLDVLFPDTEDR